MKKLSLLLMALLLLLPFMAFGEEAEPEPQIGMQNLAAIIDSLSQAREQNIIAEYGFRDSNTLRDVAEKLEIADLKAWKSALGLEAANEALDDLPLRRLEITPYRALLGKQSLDYGYNELSTIAEIAALKNIPIKKLKSMLGDKKPLEKAWDNRSVQALGFTLDEVQKVEKQFNDNLLLYTGNLTLVGMLVVFAALLITSIIISQMVHLNREKKPKAAIKLAADGTVKSAPKDISRDVIVAAIAALHIYKEEIEAERRMVLTFRRTPTNQWRASGVLSMPNREMKQRR